MKKNDMRLDAIFQYEMNWQEAKAFKICVYWEEECERIFPGERLSKIPRKGDPRKSHLFRYCWKMVRETRGILPENQQKLYVTANLTGVKKHGGRIDPNILTGEKAWMRWKVYKWLYDKAKAHINNEAPPPSIITTSPKIYWALENTKRFLFEKCDGEVSENKIKEFIDSGVFKIWTSRDQVSPNYVLLSPWVAKHVGDIEQFGQECWFNPELIRQSFTDDVMIHFRKEFEYEFIK